MAQRYRDSLDSVSRRRYEEKMSLVNGVDPYDNNTWSDDTTGLPKIEQDDISEYLVHGVSYYTRESFKAMKQLGAHNQLTSGWVKGVFTHKPEGCENIIIMAEVYHSQSLSEKPLKPWVISQQDGTILTAHCDCMAGIAESCSHVAALLFTVDATVRLRDSKTPTQVPALWVVPSNKAVMYQEASRIDFVSSAMKKKRMDSLIDGHPCERKLKRKCTVVPTPTAAEIDGLYKAIQSSSTRIKPAILSVIPEYQNEYTPAASASISNLPQLLTDLYNADLAKENYSEVVKYCRDAFNNMCVTQEQAVNAEQSTREQTQSKLWNRLRTGRVTASVAHQVCHTNPCQPSLSLIHKICHPHAKSVQTSAMNWGRDNEKNALNSYADAMKKEHQAFKLKRCGVFINPMAPHLAASPDGICYCSCHGHGCVEVKCPATKAFSSIEECGADPAFCLEKSDEGWQLKQTHAYYTQVQMQILITETDFCHFVVWTTNDSVVVRVDPNTDFMNDIVPKMEDFFVTAILPELVAHYFSRPQGPPAMQRDMVSHRNVTVTSNSVSDPQSVESGSAAAPIAVYCYCKRTEEEDNMVACDNPKCATEWFHFFCVGIKTAPKGRWYCPDCRQLPEFCRRKLLGNKQ